jgi:RNA polymerase sigma factor (sigma-70 family)
MSRIDELFAKYFKRIIGVHHRNRDADDIAQETLLAAWKRLERGKTIDDEWAYLATAARNHANRRFTRANVPRHGAGRLTQLDDDHDAPDGRQSVEAQLVEREEVLQFRAAFKAAMAELSPSTQQCLVLRKRGLGSQEIAAHLGLTDQAVRSRLSRATAFLRERLSPPPDVPWIDLLGDDDDDHQR